MDCVDCPSMVILPSGGLTMGSNAQEQALANSAGQPAEHTNWESPQHYVRVPSFAAGRYAVTKGEFAAFVRSSGYRSEAEQGNGCYMRAGKEWKTDAAYNWRKVGFAQGDDHPVVCVSWNDSQAYIQWINRISGKNYRLLSEAEREYAGRGGTQTAFWWGEGVTTSQANYHGDSSYNGSPKGLDRQATVPVNSFSANPFGLYNVHGNVWEWTQDCWHDTYIGAPTDGSAWTTGCTSPERVLRGGSWYNTSVQLRSAFRAKYIQDGRLFIIGIRIARDFSAEEIAIFSEEMARDKKNEETQAARKLKEEKEAAAKDERERIKLEALNAAQRLKEEKEAAKFAVEEEKKLKAEVAKLAAEEQKRAKAEAALKLKEEKEIAAALAEQERKQKQEAEVTRKLEAAAALAEQKRKKKEEAEQKRLEAIETARKLEEEREAAIKATQERKQKEKEEAEAARKQKEREAAIAKAEQETKKQEAIELARKLKEEREGAARAEEEKKRLEIIETARKLKEAQDTLARQEQVKADVLTIANYQEVQTQCELLNDRPDPKISVEMAYCTKAKKLADEAAIRQKEREEVEATVRKQKEKEEAVRKERERQRKEQEDRVKKMAKEFEIKDQTEDLKRRIMQAADAEISASNTVSKLEAKISDKYAASIQAAIRPNITFDADTVSGNPEVDIMVRLAMDGVTIISSQILKPSGNKSWDSAALRALSKTERLPREENGRAPQMLVITLRPREGIPTAAMITKESSKESSQGELKGLGSVQTLSVLEKRLEFERAVLADLIKKLDSDRGTFNDADSTAKASAVDFARQTAAMEELKRKNDFSVGKVVSDCLDCPELVFIPRGRFAMGSEYAPRPGAGINERPVHIVNIDDFLMGRAPVTNKQWKTVMGSNLSALLTPCRADDCPVGYVTWNSAKEFVQKLSEKTGKSYRLPNEAEWEYAARAGTTTTWSFGESEGLLGEFAWYTDNSQNKPQPVMRKKPNAFGLFDMYGNVWQWLEDCWHFNYEGAPWNGSAWVTECSLPTRVMRGGSALSQPVELRSSNRSFGPESASFFYYGLRVARDVGFEVDAVSKEIAKQTDAVRRASESASGAEREKQLKQAALRETERKLNAQRLLVEKLELDTKRIAGG